MKLIQSLTSGLVALAMLAAVSAQAAEQGIAKVVNIKGAARYMTTDNANWRPLKTGAILKPGSVIQTASESYVDVVFNNPNATGSESAALSEVDATSSASPSSLNAPEHPKNEQDAVRIFENTVLGLDKLSVAQTGADKVTDTQLDLKAGRILGTVKKLSAASKYEVKIPNGVAGIRGTVYTLSADGVLKVLTGSVVLAYVGPDGTPVTKVINAGQQYDAKTGQVTELSESDLKGMIKEAKALHIGPNTPPTTFAVDRTVYFVSPTLGRNGNGGGNSGT